MITMTMSRVFLLTTIATLTTAQLTSQNGNYGTTNSLQRDSISDSSSSNQPGYLPDYQGDRYTDPQRIAETQALNKAFFDSIGGAPSPPPETPAQQGMNSGGSTVSPSFNNGYSSTTYSPSSSTAYSTQYYNPSGAMQNSQTGYSTQPSYTNSASPQQNYVAYDTTNQNSPYYYQRVPSTAQYNSVLGVNAGYPQYTSASGQGTGTGTGMQNQLLSDPYNNQGQTQTSTAFMTYAAQQTTYSNDYNQYPYTNQPMYDSSSYQTTQSPQYSADAISCCSQVSSTCCYQTAQGNGAQANVPYSSSVYQYGRKR